MKQKMHIITLGVTDMKETLNFYETGLGWKRSKASQGDIVFFDLNGVVLAFYPWNKLAEDANTNEHSEGFRGTTLAYNTASPEETDSILAKVKDLGAEIIKPAEKAFWGGYSGYFKDPSGHLFEVAYNPFATFDDNGNLSI
jgi:hypothetical protein